MSDTHNPFRIRYDPGTEDRSYEGASRSFSGDFDPPRITHVIAVGPQGDETQVARIDGWLWEPEPGSTVHLLQPVRQGRVKAVEYQITGEGFAAVVLIDDPQREQT